MALIEIASVRYRYPTDEAWVLDGISLQVEAGEYVVLAGASGSGKSTLLRLLNGLIPHFYGGELVGGVRIGGIETREQPVHNWLPYVGLVFQNPEAQLFASSVERELTFGLESLGLPRDEIHARVNWASEVAHITPLLKRAPLMLSGGEQQRVAVAAVLALRPRVLALDEPFTNLDPEAAQDLRAILRTVRSEGTTVIVAEHRLAEMLADATRLVILAEGAVAIDDTPRSALTHDLAPLGVNVPTLVRFARAMGNHGVPLSVDEALAMGMRVPAKETRSGTLTPAMGMRRRVVEARALGHDLDGTAVLRDVNVDIGHGEVVALVGRNGSGKTTFLKHLNALRRPSRGSLVVLGYDTRHARVADLASRVGLVFQNPNDQLFKLTVREEVEIGARSVGRYDLGVMESLYEAFGLRLLLERSPFRLSEGQKKRVAFASALAARPELLVLDEPTVGQDAPSRDALVSWLRGLEQTVVVATHDLEFAQDVATRWIALADGMVVADGTPDAVMSDAGVMARAGLKPTPRFALTALTPNSPLATSGQASPVKTEEGGSPAHLPGIAGEANHQAREHGTPAGEWGRKG